MSVSLGEKAFKAELEVPLPTDVSARAEVVGKLASAWSKLMSTVDAVWDEERSRQRNALLPADTAEPEPKPRPMPISKKKRGRPRKNGKYR